jgi:aspartate/methionine/tyrosine aminotransferase
MMELARAMPDVVHLEVGDPDFITPQHIIDGAAAAATAGFTKYTASAGLLSLRELIAAKVTARNRLPTTADQVVVTTGGGGGLFTTMLALLDPGDEVLIPNPWWPGYPALVHVARGISKPYPLDRNHGYAPDLDALEARVGPRTKAIVVNSPANPTGAVYGEETLRGILTIAQRHDLWVVSDECYDEIVFEGTHVTAATLGERDRVITVFTFSKSYAMTGWRVGYVVASTEFAQVLTKLQEPVNACTSAISQKAAEAALLGPQDCVGRMRDSYRARRDLATALLDREGIGYVRPRGAFYLMVDISAAGSSADFAHHLLTDYHVATVPGDAFGPGGQGMVRVSLSASEEALRTGLARLASAVRRAAPRSPTGIDVKS